MNTILLTALLIAGFFSFRSIRRTLTYVKALEAEVLPMRLRALQGHYLGKKE